MPPIPAMAILIVLLSRQLRREFLQSRRLRGPHTAIRDQRRKKWEIQHGWFWLWSELFCLPGPPPPSTRPSNDQYEIPHMHRLPGPHGTRVAAFEKSKDCPVVLICDSAVHIPKFWNCRRTPFWFQPSRLLPSSDSECFLTTLHWRRGTNHKNRRLF